MACQYNSVQGPMFLKPGLLQLLPSTATTSSLFTVSTTRPKGPTNPVAAPDSVRVGAVLPLAVRRVSLASCRVAGFKFLSFEPSLRRTKMHCRICHRHIRSAGDCIQAALRCRR